MESLLTPAKAARSLLLLHMSFLRSITVFYTHSVHKTNSGMGRYNLPLQFPVTSKNKEASILPFYSYCQALGTHLTRELRKIRNTGKLPTIDIFILQWWSWSRVSESLYWSLAPPFLPLSPLVIPVSHSGPLPSHTAFRLLPRHACSLPH